MNTKSGLKKDLKSQKKTCRNCKKSIEGTRRRVFCSSNCYFEGHSKDLVARYHEYQQAKAADKVSTVRTCAMCGSPNIGPKSKFCVACRQLPAVMRQAV